MAIFCASASVSRVGVCANPRMQTADARSAAMAKALRNLNPRLFHAHLQHGGLLRLDEPLTHQFEEGGQEAGDSLRRFDELDANRQVLTLRSKSFGRVSAMVN